MYLTKKFNLELTFFELIYNYLREFVIPRSFVSFLKKILNLKPGNINEHM